jgi:hypothetical protein
MHGPEQTDPHHLGYPARIVAVTFVDLLRLQKRHHVPGLDAEHGQPGCRKTVDQPLRKRARLNVGTLNCRRLSTHLRRR